MKITSSNFWKRENQIFGYVIFQWNHLKPIKYIWILALTENCNLWLPTRLFCFITLTFSLNYILYMFILILCYFIVDIEDSIPAWITAQERIFHKVFHKGFFSKYYQISSLLRIWSHLLKKSLMEDFIFCALNRKGMTTIKWCLN